MQVRAARNRSRRRDIRGRVGREGIITEVRGAEESWGGYRGTACRSRGDGGEVRGVIGHEEMSTLCWMRIHDDGEVVGIEVAWWRSSF